MWRLQNDAARVSQHDITIQLIYEYACVCVYDDDDTQSVPGNGILVELGAILARGYSKETVPRDTEETRSD